MSDPLSEIFDLVGVESSVYFQKDFCAPWGMRVENTGFAQFHILVRGEASLWSVNRRETLNAGDVVLFPKGAAHLISDSPDSPGVPGQDVIRAHLAGDPLFEGTGRRTRMICGHFEYDFDTKHPLVQEFPDTILIRSDALPSMIDLTGLLNILIKESNVSKPGTDVLIQKLSEALLVTILRAYFETSENRTGFHAGLREPRIARVISAIHEANWDELGLEKLAIVAGMSRSALALQFKSIIGYSPGEYSIRWKLLKASRRLTQSTESVDEIASQSGYKSSTAFSRAFQRMFSMTPSEYRRIKTNISPIEQASG